METPIINSSRMEEIRRRRKQKNRKILLSLAAGVVVLAAAVAVLVWALNRPQEEPLPSGPRLEEALAGGSTQGWRYRVAGGLSAHQAQCPLPCYTFSPPEGYTQVLNAREDANALSDSHTDLYSTLGAEYFDRWDPDNFDPIWDLEYGHWFEFGDSALPEGTAESRIRFDQQFALDGVTVEFAPGVTPYRLKLGEMVVYYGSNEQGTQIYWVYQDSLLSLATTEILNQQEVMDWVDRQVDYTGAEPVYSPLELVRGESYAQYAAQHPGEMNYNPQVFHVQGNPQLPEDIAPYDFATPPEGFAKINPSGEEALSTPAQLQAYSSSYQGEGKIWVTNYAGSTPVLGMDGMEVQDEADLVEDVTVNGCPGFYYLQDNTAKLVWVTPYLTVELDYRGSISREELIALGESLVEMPGEALPEPAEQP